MPGRGKSLVVCGNSQRTETHGNREIRKWTLLDAPSSTPSRNFRGGLDRELLVITDILDIRPVTPEPVYVVEDWRLGETFRSIVKTQVPVG